MPHTSLAELEMDGLSPKTVSAPNTKENIDATSADIVPIFDNDKDYFVEKDGVKFAGTHVLVELWGASNLDDPKQIEETLCHAARDAGATILHSHTHHFSPYSGVSGVVVLAESHITIHTWPEKGFAAIDIFMCGACNPLDAIPRIERLFEPESLEVSEHRRGLVK